mmetsp:Transcript_74130/g.141097  ORF Transcript_74130/g.141097 Transcript_74130/m.141097 type:complete len:109 (-) Transcript_74130:41-367(-)
MPGSRGVQCFPFWLTWKVRSPKKPRAVTSALFTETALQLFTGYNRNSLTRMRLCDIRHKISSLRPLLRRTDHQHQKLPAIAASNPPIAGTESLATVIPFELFYMRASA